VPECPQAIGACQTVGVAEYIEWFNTVDPVEEARKFLEWLKQIE
jgi:cobalamin biosynthesis Mg chelatase CobN